MDKIQYITVEALNNYIKGVFAQEVILQDIVVLGEVSGIRVSGNHAYFTLKDKNAQIAISDFGYRRYHLPKEGEQVLIKGRLDYYVTNGKLSLIVEDIIPYGAGFLAQQLEKLKQKLKAEGYFDESHKKPIPKFPQKVCVITAKSGAVIRDIITTTRLKNSRIDIYVYDVKVQGLGANKEIINAIKLLDNKGFDILIIARGGGSLEDLMPFNSEELVYAIYNANTPIISAVGHETDFSLSDFVADVRAATPTAAAQIIAYDVEETKKLFKEYEQKLFRILSQYSQKLDSRYKLAQKGLMSSFELFYSNKLNNLEKFLSIITNLANNKMQNLDVRYKHLLNKISQLSCEKLIKQDAKANMLFARFEANNPAKIFTKGYGLLDKNGEKINSISQLNVGDKINIKTIDGKAKAEILEVKHEI